MDAYARPEDDSGDEEPTEPESVITCHETRPGHAVFTERDNTDGWIATDLTVELDR